MVLRHDVFQTTCPWLLTKDSASWVLEWTIVFKGVPDVVGLTKVRRSYCREMFLTVGGLGVDCVLSGKRRYNGFPYGTYEETLRAFRNYLDGHLERDILSRSLDERATGGVRITVLKAKVPDERTMRYLEKEVFARTI